MKRRRVFAIRHKPTGGFLPEVGRSYTHSEPSTTRIPRLFNSKGGAKCALTWWLMGATTVQVKYGSVYEDEICPSWDTVPKPHRIGPDMEVVPLLLSEMMI